MTEVTVTYASAVRNVGWFPNNGREVWVEITVDGQKFVRRLELPLKDDEA